MKLKYANIVNFRSIQEVRVDFEPQCRILVGINESGKSNILRALSMIGSDFVPTPEDVREPLPREKSITEAYIRFVLSLNKEDIEKVYSGAREKVLTDKENIAIIKRAGKNLTLRQFCLSRNEGIYRVDVIEKKKSPMYWRLLGIGGYSVAKNWKRPSESCPATYNVELDGNAVPLKNYTILNIDHYPDIPTEYLTDVSAEDINDLVGSEITKIVSHSLPKVIFWKYDEENLLPPSVNIDAFAANPDSCVPLKNMFMLAGVKDIGLEINNARQTSSNKIRNLLRRVATHTTNHFRSVWKEYKEISFALEPNASNIEANIVEKNYWKMSQRSDGVKRFITFLLHISANVKANLLNGALLLIDEPDMGLHPSGSRYLRDELIETSTKNYVVFSTHSIFMIDKDNIGRHIIVKKEGEKTTIDSADKSNFVDEEVLFNALNFSVFDILQRNNIIFEGWRDKKLFQVAIENIPASYALTLKSLKERAKSLGLCHAEGVKDIRNITPVIELANRKCLIISDADTPAKEKQKEYQKIQGYGLWKRYDEIQNNIGAETSEDFIKQVAFSQAVAKVLKAYPALTGNPVIPTSGRLSEVKKWLVGQKISADETREILDELKNSIFNNLKTSDIDVAYYEFLKNLLPFLNVM